ncbi:MAG TPA: M14 family metallopeptidase [Cyclobacteriaceae bacterium]|nr:M14 family metallopeptidase [Cyclobacteriaceae bacterium]
MKKLLFLFALTLGMSVQAQNNYFFPTGVSFDPAIPTPEQFLGYPVGDWHTRHDRIVSYFQELARLSPKAHFQIIGYTNERRPQVVLTITSPENYARIEDIRKEHLKLADPSQPANISSMPVIITLGYNVHGNEPSSSEAALLTAYYMIAAQGAEAERTLKEGVIHIDPNYNPDGRDRHSNWANMHKGFPPVADPMDREHNEVWPGGRTNHYWFDLNRDWLPLAHVESRNRIEFFHQWLPNVCTDFHEMGTNATHFFEPTKPYASENPVVPRANYDVLNPLFAKYFAKALDDIGSLYYSKESFDNSYPGYGSTYPDIHGGLGLLFEQASSRGHVQKSSTKEVTFAFTIRNHVRSGLATVKAGVENRELLLKHQQDYFKSALDEGRKSSVKAYVFGDSKDQSRTRAFADLLLKHRIGTYQLGADLSVGPNKYEKGKAFVVTTDQTQYRMVRSMFEKVTSFHDSVFYDASAWTMALAYGLPHDALNATTKFSKGERVTTANLIVTPATITQSNYAYLIEWNEYNSARALYYLLSKGVFVKTSFNSFAATVNGAKKNFGYGTLVIPVADQNISSDELFRLIKEASATAGVDVVSVTTGLSTEGIDLGSNNVRTVKPPKVAMLIGDGVASTDAGAIWYLFDSKLSMPITKVNTSQFARLQIADYNTLILAAGNYAMLGEAGISKIKTWMQQGGTLILLKSAVSWAINSKLIDEQLKKEEEKKDTKRMDYVTAADYQGSRAIGGSIYKTNLDITHPLGFGYTSRELPVWRNTSVFIEPSKSSFNRVIQYTANPLLSGYIHPTNLEKIKNSVSLQVSNVGQGRAILFVDDPAFRGYWYGTNKLLFNAVFFGGLLTSGGFGGGEEE